MNGKVDKLIKFPQKIFDEITEFQKVNYITSFHQAVIQLIIKGLRKDGKNEN